MLQGVLFDIDSVLFAKNGHPELPYVKNFISQLKSAKKKLAIASLAPLSDIFQALTRNFLTDCFDALISGSDLPHLKPAPDIFLLAAQALGLSPADCILIGDSNDGMQASNAANIPCIGFSYPPFNKHPLSSAYALLESFEAADTAYLCRTHAHALGYPAKIRKTKRLLIRELSMDDFPALYAMCTAPETAPWMNETLSDFSTEQEKHRAYLSNVYPFFDLALWGVYERKTGKLIGRAGFSLPEGEDDSYSLGYLIATPYRRQGLAAECVSALLAYAKEQGVTTVLAHRKVDNLASQRVLDACGISYRKIAATEKFLTYRLFLSEPDTP